MHLSSKMRVIDEVLRKRKIVVNMKRETILILESLNSIHESFRLIYIGYKYILSGPFGQTICSIGRILNGLTPFLPNEKCFCQFIDKF